MRKRYFIFFFPGILLGLWPYDPSNRLGCLRLGKTKDKTPQTFVQILSIVLTVAAHAHGEALLQPAILTSISMVFRHFARLVAPTRVTQLFPNGTFEKPFTAFAAYSAVMTTYK